MSTTALLMSVLFGALLFCVPIGFSIGLSIAAICIFTPLMSSNMLFSTMYSSCDSFALLAVPFFVLSGDIMASCGISRRLINFARTLVGHVSGGLGIVCVVACMFFAAISGSGVATAAAIGSVMIPIMVKDRYDSSFACSLTAMASAVGPIIPPSVPFIIYAVMCNVSVSDLFLGGVVPGLMMGIAMAIFTYFYSKRHSYGTVSQRASWKEVLVALWDAKWSILMPLLVLGGIYSGVFTPTESAVVASGYSLIIGLFVYREIKFSDLVKIVARSTITMGQVMALLIFATVLGKVFVLNQVPNMMAQAVVEFTDSRIMVLLLMNVILLIAGMFLETLAAITIFAPLLLAVAQPFGVSPLHFGVMMTVNLAIGLATPPVGASLYVAAGIGKISIEKTFRSLIPLIAVNLVVLAMITYYDPFVTFLPALLRH
jgi:C4-dicarboxylate transporter DctM subunit